MEVSRDEAHLLGLVLLLNRRGKAKVHVGNGVYGSIGVGSFDRVARVESCNNAQKSWS